jgi:hypothetical protein
MENGKISDLLIEKGMSFAIEMVNNIKIIIIEEKKKNILKYLNLHIIS